MGEIKEKRIKAKVEFKHETAANWELSAYIPKVNEIVLYDPDDKYNYTRQKNGDGIHMVKDLPFVGDDKQNKLPINTSGSSNRLWIATCNKLKDADGNKRPATIIGTVVIPRTTLGETYLDNADISQLNIISGLNTLTRVAEIRAMGQGEYIEYASKNSSTTVGGKKISTTTLTYYWTNPYQLKRIIALTDGNGADAADGPGPRTGVTTVTNFFDKWKRKEINSLMEPEGVNNLKYINAAGEEITYNNLEAYKQYLILRYQLATASLTEFADETKNAFYLACKDYFTEDNGFPFDIETAADNEEPLMETLITRDVNGRCIVESGIYDFHAVNKKQMDAKADEVLASVNTNIEAAIAQQAADFNASQTAQDKKITELKQINPRASYTIKRNDAGILDITNRDQAAVKSMTGWYRIAETDGSGYFSNTFHIQVFINRPGYLSDITFTVQKAFYDTDPTITVLNNSFRTKFTNPIDKIRVVHSYADKNPAYVDVHICLSSTPDNAWDGTSTETNDAQYKIFVENILTNGTDNWKLINPPPLPGNNKFVQSTLVSNDVSDGYNVFEVLPADKAWSNVTRTVSDINDLVTEQKLIETLENIQNSNQLEAGNGISIDGRKVSLDADIYRHITDPSKPEITTFDLSYKIVEKPDITFPQAVGYNETILLTDYYQAVKDKYHYLKHLTLKYGNTVLIDNILPYLTDERDEYSTPILHTDIEDRNITVRPNPFNDGSLVFSLSGTYEDPVTKEEIVIKKEVKIPIFSPIYYFTSKAAVVDISDKPYYRHWVKPDTFDVETTVENKYIHFVLPTRDLDSDMNTQIRSNYIITSNGVQVSTKEGTLTPDWAADMLGGFEYKTYTIGPISVPGTHTFTIETRSKYYG